MTKTKKGLIGGRPKYTGRSQHAGMAAPFEWGPGPWDYDEHSWSERSMMSGDLRTYDGELPITGGPIVSKPGTAHAIKGKYIAHPNGPDDEGMLMSMCWCKGSFVRIPMEWVREGWTVSCGGLNCHEAP